MVEQTQKKQHKIGVSRTGCTKCAAGLGLLVGGKHQTKSQYPDEVNKLTVSQGWHPYCRELHRWFCVATTMSTGSIFER